MRAEQPEEVVATDREDEIVQELEQEFESESDEEESSSSESE